MKPLAPPPATKMMNVNMKTQNSIAVFTDASKNRALAKILTHEAIREQKKKRRSQINMISPPEIIRCRDESIRNFMNPAGQYAFVLKGKYTGLIAQILQMDCWLSLLKIQDELGHTQFVRVENENMLLLESTSELILALTNQFETAISNAKENGADMTDASLNSPPQFTISMPENSPPCSDGNGEVFEVKMGSTNLKTNILISLGPQHKEKKHKHHKKSKKHKKSKTQTVKSLTAVEISTDL